ncbi:MAG: FecR domain-containing protein [Pseudolabrys sp.]|nr:FecR domain-containing protein [Pseudolabrys sp.]
MLRDASDLDVETFSFAGHGERTASSIVDIQSGAGGATATIPDAHLLFNADFIRAGHDLILRGHDGGSAFVRDYFASDERATLMSRDGAKLTGDLVEAMSGALAPNQYAQAGTPAPAASDAVGRVVTASGDASIIRNGVAVTLKPGDPVLRADVLQTQAGTMAVTFNDGSTLNLTANTRIVVSEFVYSPNGAGNSQLLNLVQGSLTFISGEVAHSGNMRIGTPVATMGIRGTVGGVTTANDGTVHFYVSQSATGAVIINEQGQIIANVVQDGPMIIVRPVGPLQVVAEEIQKSPAQLALELQALQQIVSIKAVGDQLLQQFFQQQNPNGPNPQSPQNGPHTQILIDLNKNPANANGGDPPPDENRPFDQATIHLPPENPDGPVMPGTVIDLLHANLPPVTFAPLAAALSEDQTLSFSGSKAISVHDADTQVLTVTVSVTHGVVSLAGIAGLTFASGNGASGATLTFSGTQAAINAALHGMMFTPPADFNGAASLTITTDDGNSPAVTTSVPIAVAAVNDAPVIGGVPSTPISYTENDAATVVNASLSLSDVDSTTLTGATVKIAANFASGEDVLSFTSHGGITGSYDAQTGILTLSGVATLADYQAVLRSVTYANTSDDPSDAPRTIAFQVNDGSAQHSASNVVSVTVEVSPVNGAPVLTLGGNVADQFDSQAYDLNSGTAHWITDWIENENGDYAPSPTTGEIKIAADPYVSDTGFRLFLSDDDNESGAADTIQRTADLSGASSATLTFDYRRQISTGDSDDVVKVWVSTDGVNFTQIGQIGASGYGAFVDGSYQHFSVDISSYISPTTTIRFSVDDGVDDGDWFYIDNVKIGYLGTSGSSGSAAYVEGNSPVSIVPDGALIDDVDDTMLQSATITLTNAQAGDLLSVCGQLPAGIVASSYDAQTGVLTLSGEAALADYQMALAQVHFSNTGDNPGGADRTIAVVVSDGSANSNAATVTVHVTPVNDAPMLDAHSAALSYGEGQSAAAIASAITVADVDSGQLIGAKVQITGNFAPSEDVLGFVNQNGITGNYNSATGLLTLTGLATLAQYQAALASVTYSNADALSTATRTISFTVDDGQTANHASDPVTVDVTVAAVDDMLSLSASAWAASSSIDLGGGVNVLNVTADGTDISASGTPTVAHVDTGNLTGTGGTDTITLTGLQLDNILIGSGKIDLGAGSGDTINLKSTSADLNTLGATNASIVGVEAISAAGAGASASIDLHGQSEAFTITGSANADTLIGGSGIDTINGGNGADIIIGGAGADNVTGGLGADTFVVSAVSDLAAGETINGSAESGTIDTLRLDASGTYNLTTFSTITNIDKILFNQDAAGFIVSVNPSVVATADANGDGNPGGYGDILFDSAVAMTHGVTINTSGMNSNFIHVIGTNLGGDDILNGNGGADIIDGGAGNDVIFAGLGADVLTGGYGADIFKYSNAGQLSGDTIDGTLESGTLDTLRFDAAGTFNLATATISHIDQVTFNANSAGFNLTVTNAQVSTADANGDGTTDDMAVNASVTMSNGVTINASGLTGANHIIVDGTNLGGNDTITGGAGNDTISGGAGNDTLTGGTGADTFVFHAGFGNDTVMDFVHGTDILQFDSDMFATAQAVIDAVTTVSGEAVITLGADTVTLHGVSAATLTTADIHINQIV